jgi:2-oxo-3-hexenedioate decarboxylase
MNQSDFDALVSDLVHARDAASLTSRPSLRHSGFDLEEGYTVARALHQHLAQRGFVSIGRKIGFANPATWQEFDLDTPIWAHVYAQTVHWAEEGRYRLALDRLVAPRIEPEVVLKLRGPLPDGDASVEEWTGCIEWAAIGFEIVHCHYPDWRFTAPDTLADFGLHARLVVGPCWRVAGHEQRQVASALANLTVRLSEGSDTKATGLGRNALGGPVLALVHLAQVISRQSWAPALGDGEIISTGTLTPFPYISSGERWRVEVTGAPLAPLELELTE